MGAGDFMKKSNYFPIVFMGLTMICALSFLYWSELSERVVTASSSENGRELPIYSVKTENPQIALSFDAAWGNARYGFLSLDVHN